MESVVGSEGTTRLLRAWSGAGDAAPPGKIAAQPSSRSMFELKEFDEHSRESSWAESGRGQQSLLLM